MKTFTEQPWETVAYPINESSTDLIRTFLVSRAMPSAGKLDGLAYPHDKTPLALTEQMFADGFCDLHKDLFHCAPSDVLVYVACRIICPEAMKLDLYLGYDGPVKLWLDGQQLFHDSEGANPAVIDAARVRCEAAAGSHEVLIALGSNQGKAWGLFLRLKRGDLKDTVVCTVYPAIPTRLPCHGAQGCSAALQGDAAVLANDHLSVEIPLRTAVIRNIHNKITDQTFALAGDRLGFAATVDGRETVSWMAGAETAETFSVKTDGGSDAARVDFTAQAEGLNITISYEIHREQFWVERRITVESGTCRVDFDRLVYGRLDVSGSQVRTLELGKFDRPRLVTSDQGGLFSGVGWWFYTVDEAGVYQNTDMQYTVTGRFESEPWYVGVLAAEEGEPYPGWLWYRHFLELRKAAYDRQSSWSYWNAGWGQWGIDIDDPSAPPYIDLAHRLGIRSIAFGSGGEGKGIPAYVALARSSDTTRRNMAELKRFSMVGGFLESGCLGKRWADDRVVNDKLGILDEYVAEGFQAFHFDFFESVDSFAAHRNVTRYFRAARERLSYTECHLGMADYGPQFQREVLINHPNDLHGFDLSHFSSDWTTFLGFRSSRAEWQRRHQYLMTEAGLYYYVTHYANWGHPRQYTDPEPHQLLYGPAAYCGLAYNFHDAHGFREAVAAAAAFSPHDVFGHLDLKMPERDITFAREYLQWVSDNVAVLRWGRICMEDKTGCVVSKIRDGRGAIFVLNYAPASQTFRITLRTGSAKALHVRRVYPVRQDEFSANDGATIEVKLRGESCAILDIGHGLKSLPPENLDGLSIDIGGWEKRVDEHVAHVTVPPLPELLARDGTPDLPKELLSLDQIPTAALASGRGRLPEAFLRAYEIREDGRVATWKLAPWAFADRLWLVYVPGRPLRLSGPLPTVRVNGRSVTMVPRIDYRRGKPEEWLCPLFFADVTAVCRQGQDNTVSLAGISEAEPASVRIISAVRNSSE